jgi:hypothetical protein
MKAKRIKPFEAKRVPLSLIAEQMIIGQLVPCMVEVERPNETRIGRCWMRWYIRYGRAFGDKYFTTVNGNAVFKRKAPAF